MRIIRTIPLNPLPWTLGLLALVALAACGGGQGTSTGLTGQIEIDGSSTVFPITEAVAEEFHGLHPGVRVNVGVSGTGGGFKRFTVGDTDISNASRPIKASEEGTAADNAVEYLEISVGIDGLAVLVHPGNGFVSCLTVEELSAIWQPGSGMDSWSQVRPGLPDEPMRLYGPGTDSGTFDYFTEEINGESGASRPDFTASEDDNVLVQGIAGDRQSLGYFGYAYYAVNTDKLKALEIDAGDGCVAPVEETIESGEYPLARPLFIYVSTGSLERPEVRTFVEFYLEHAGELVTEVGYVPFAESVYQDQLGEVR